MVADRRDTNFLRTIAILLILNSHLDSFYPIQYFASGGMIGNSLFFMLSAMGLWVSWQNNKITFLSWYNKRILRIYPSVWITIILLIIPYGIYLGNVNTQNLLSKMGMFFFPPFWFLQALMLFYVCIYLILRYYNDYILHMMFALLLIAYAVFYLFILDLSTFSIETMPFRILFYFMVTLFGLYLGIKSERIKFKGITDLVLFIFFLLIIYGHKYLIKIGLLESCQFVQHLAVFPLLFYSLKLSRSKFISHYIMNESRMGRILVFIAGLTLEIFIVESSIEGIISKVIYPFPLNLILFLLSTLILAYFINRASRKVKLIIEEPLYKH